MARDMALAGVDRSELTPPPPPEQPRTLKGKWQNFWYHYKVAFWIIAAIVLIAVTIVVQTVTADPADYEIVAVTEMALYPTEIDALEQYLASCGEDIDGDGKVEVTLENLVPSFDADGSSSIGLADQQKLVNYIAAAEKMLFVFDRVSYEGFTQSIREVTSDDYTFFAPLDITDAGYDAEGHYWCWSEDTRRQTEALSALPADMLFGVRTPEGTAGGKKAAQLFEQGVALIKQVSETAE